MKFSLISDMHVNHPQPKTPYDKLEEFVVVAGDTSDGLDGVKFLNKLKRKGHTVFAVDGNHEHYCNFSQGREQKETEEAFYANLGQTFVMQMPEHKLEFIGCNGWYTVDNESRWAFYMHDSEYCRLSAEQVNKLAYDDYMFLMEYLDSFPLDRKAVVVTHTSPCRETLDPKFDGHYSNNWYYNPYMREVLKKHKDKIAVWCHGHTHARNEAIVEGVRVVCNPRGYPRENPLWEPLTIEV